MAKRTRSEEENIKYEDLSLGLLNINGLRYKTHEARHIIARDKLHAVALCETKLNTKVADSVVYIPGFSMWRKDRNDQSNNTGGGVALYVQDHIETRLRPDLMKTKTNVKDPDVEIIWVEMKLPEDRPVLLGCCYRRKKNKTKYFEHIKETMDLIEKNDEDKDVFLMGDFNTDRNVYEKKKADEARKKADGHSSTLCWNQIVKVPTRVTIDSETCIDHIYTNISDPLKPESIPTGCSDHNLITVKVSREIPQSKGNFRSNKLDLNQIKGEFNKDINKMLTGVSPQFDPKSDPKEALATFTEAYLSVVNRYAPLGEKNIYDSLMLNEVLKELIKERDEKKKNIIDLISPRIKEKKNYQDQIDEHLNRKTQRQDEGVEDEDEDDADDSAEQPIDETPEEAAASEEEQAGELSSTSTDTTDSELGSIGSPDQQIDRSETLKFYFCSETTSAVKQSLIYVCDQVIKVLDQTEAELMKLSVESISAPICDILNRCINNSRIPMVLKVKQTFNGINFRQQSDKSRVYMILSYAFDVILYKQVKSFFFMDKKKSEATLKEKLEQLKTASNKTTEANRPVIAVLLDFTSFFDTISHEQLIRKLEESGFSDLALELIKSFLSIHKNKDKDEDKDHRRSSGLPRGSCLTQLLHIIIINDLKEKLEPEKLEAVICNSYMMIYADGDTETVQKELDDGINSVETRANQFNISFEIRRKLFKPSDLPALSKILESMLRCHGDESNWIRAPGNIVKQNGDWKYDNITKELELNFGPDSLQRSGKRNLTSSEDSAGDTGVKKRNKTQGNKPEE